jgi:hypothetical protein
VSLRIQDSALPQIRTIARKIGGRVAALTIAGRAGMGIVQRHLREKNESNPNKIGGRRTNFWSEVARSVFVGKATANSVTISIGHPAIGIRYHGGTIVPKRVKYLTIPLIPEAYGKTALTYETNVAAHALRSKNPTRRAAGQQMAAALRSGSRSGALFPVRTKAGNLVLAEHTSDGGIKPVFSLVKSVKIKADKTALPSDDVFTAAVMSDLSDYADSVVSQT